MTLGEKQREFNYMTALLILHARQLGYGFTNGDSYRDPRVEYGHKYSLHRSRLAVDYNVFKAHTYLRGKQAKDVHSLIHDYWDMIGGNQRIKSDLNHYSYNPGDEILSGSGKPMR